METTAKSKRVQVAMTLAHRFVDFQRTPRGRNILLLLFLVCVLAFPAFVVGLMVWKRASTPEIHVAAGSGDTARVAHFLARGVDINLRAASSHGGTPLHFAAEAGQLGTIELLLAKGANIDAKDDTGKTALHWTAYSYSKGGYDPNTRALRARAGKLLLARGAARNAQDHHGDTPLTFAIKDQNAFLVRVLLDHGASVRTRNAQGYDQIDMARMYASSRKADPQVLSLIEAAATQPATQPQSDATPTP